MRIALVLIWTLLGFTYSSISQAWGKFGHLTVCDLAYRNLTPTSRQALQDLLHSRSGGIRVEGRGALPDRHYTSFNLGCLEEDELPRSHPADHFINVDRDTTTISSTQCPGGAQCILAGIQRDFDVLKDTSRPDEERVFSLMALGALAGRYPPAVARVVRGRPGWQFDPGADAGPMWKLELSAKKSPCRVGQLPTGSWHF